MKRRGLQLNRRHRLTVYSASLLLLVSGAAWAWADQLDESAQVGETVRQWKPWLLKIHGFSAMAFVLLLGTLLTGHVRRSWHARKNRANGAFFLGAVSVLTISGYALYYLGDETWRNATSQFHLWLGLSSPILLYWHIRSGRRATAER
jgi:hypothetical protein